MISLTRDQILVGHLPTLPDRFLRPCIVILQQLLKVQPFIFEAHYLSKKGLTANLAKIKGPLTLWDLQYLSGDVNVFIQWWCDLKCCSSKFFFIIFKKYKQLNLEKF